MKANTIAATFIVCAACAIGAFNSMNSLGGLVFIPKGMFESVRTPAAIRKGVDFSYLEGSALRTASQRRLVSEIKVVPDADRIGVQLGHFIMKGSDGQPQYACDYYDHIVLTFIGEGIATSGEKPMMQVEGPCVASDDVAHMSPLWIATKQIHREKPADGYLEFPAVASETHYHFTSMGSEWPPAWSLQGVRLFHESDAAHEITVGNDQLREILPQPIVITW